MVFCLFVCASFNIRMSGVLHESELEGEYSVPLPFSSIGGLALRFKSVITSSKPKNKTFRNLSVIFESYNLFSISYVRLPFS